MAILGLRGTGSWNATQERPTNFREMILFLWPNGDAPITALLSKLRSEATNDPQFTWFEKAVPTQQLVVNAATDTATTINMAAEALNVKAGHVLLNVRTNEQMLVTADPAVDTAITVKRGWGEVAGVAINASDKLVVVGSAYQEGDNTPTAVAYVPVRPFNYTQIFRTSLNITRTAKRTRLRTGDAIREAKREALQLHSVEMEKGFMFGQRNEDLTGAQPRRATRGVKNWIVSNNKDFAGTVTEGAFDDWMEQVFRYGSNEKLALAGSTALNTLNKLAKNRSQMVLEPAVNTYGMALMRYVTPFGQLLVRQHPLFNLTDTYRGDMLLLDVDKLNYRYIDDTQYIKNRQGNGIDASLDEFLTEAGLEVHHEQCHGWAKGMTTFTP